ncbi:hypothetical protein ElyMa_004589300 [Elysia marginata]|uniref:Uncharacterized protein n=1 Tax=Elysia marginata TaxID=1093978 RepID=A0AAV4HU26_9GAST|nr:hypothetical protein ElyMa_004589300 [Elysia marginata]
MYHLHSFTARVFTRKRNRATYALFSKAVQPQLRPSFDLTQHLTLKPAWIINDGLARVKVPPCAPVMHPPISTIAPNLDSRRRREGGASRRGKSRPEIALTRFIVGVSLLFCDL